MGNTKIVSLEKLGRIAKDARLAGRKVVHCHGVFDLLHIGHIRYLEQAKDMGDVLAVTLTPDRFVDKGPHRPAFTEVLRAEAIASLACVDYVAINEWPTAEETLRQIKPSIYVKGAEFKGITTDPTGKIALEEKICREIGTQMAFTEDIVFSSTHLINSYLTLYPKELAEYLDVFRQRHTLDEVLNTIEQMKSLKVLVIGDAIIDEYVYCSTIGKSSKDPVLAMRYLSDDRFAGGSLAIANHMADFASEVTLLSVLGTKNDYRHFIEASLDSRVRSHFIEVPNWQTICKRRFLDAGGPYKMFEVYLMDDNDLPFDTVARICAFLKEDLKNYDVVLVADFGHGAVPPAAVDILCEQAPYLAVNTQANAGNRGFHTISRYRRADYVCLAEPEVRLDARSVRGELRPLMEAVHERLQCQVMVATRGRHGCLVSTRDGKFTAVPSFATNIVDRVGAGDAFLSVTALAAKMGVDLEVLGFLGNVVGAEAVQVVGNAKPISKMSVTKHVTSLLK